MPNSLINGKTNMFSPRIGIAYKPWTKRTWLIRTGYGLFFNGSVYGTFVNKLSAQPPFANTANLVTSSATPLTLQNGFPRSLVGHHRQYLRGRSELQSGLLADAGISKCRATSARSWRSK